MAEITDIRPSPIAGQWYPGSAERLRTSIDGYMDAADLPAIDGDIMAIVAPHAGYVYSGPVAGHAFAAVRGQSPEMVAVISPLHQPSPNALFTSDHDAYKTPLGSVLIDKQAVQDLDDRLKAELGFGLSNVRNDGEHSLEIELPFLQRALAGEFKLLPVMVREQTEAITHALGNALAQTLAQRDCLLVASTDLSHFYSQEIANDFDETMLSLLESFDPEGFLKAEEEQKGFACGRGAVAAILWAAKELGADKVKIVNYATSGDVSGDYSRVVGYGAAVIYKSNY
ncbi:MAG: AmmeMemoRadiSam system protein B [Anaerolineales bacterium]|nr:AmmeMemoRadiSam system protein B [Chloroflexota bacterium]MBL6980796.1 AmmeMemoRadiSam system protein B [Anaerolineales bacterium]